MNSRTLKVEKPKSKYTQSTINLSYKGNASELQSKPSIRQGGLQLVGKLQGTRRNPPPPPWIPSLKAEMGGQDTRINLVPPGGSGWGTGPNATSTSQPGSTTTSSTILKDDEKGEPKAGSENAQAASSTEQNQLNPTAKLSQKPFFAPRPKIASSKSGADGLQESLSGSVMSTGPTVPFYHRQPTTQTISMPDTPVPDSPSTPDLPVGEDSKQDKAASSNPSTVHTGWAAVTNEEPDFQERINFSDDEEAETSCSSSVNRSQIPPATEPCWTDSLSGQQSAQTPTSCLPQTTWKAPTPTISSSVTTMVSLPTSYSASPDHIFHAANGNVMIPEPPMMRDPMSAVQAFSTMSLYNTDAQLQAQREARTREYQHAVNRALMERRKTSYMEAAEPKPVETSSSPLAKTIADSRMFLQSHISSSSSQPPQQPNIASLIAAVAAAYGNSFQSLLPNMAAGKSSLPFQTKPPPAQPPVVQSPWPAASFSSPQPQFMQQFPFAVSTAPKVANQAPCLNTELFLEKLLEACKSQTPTDVPVGQKTAIPLPRDLTEKQSEDADSMFRVPSHGPSESELLDNQLAEFSQRKPTAQPRENFELLSKHTTERNSPLCDTDKMSGVKSQQSVETGNRLTDSPPASDSNAQPLTQHITPLMEVDLPNKWTDKDFNAFEAGPPAFQPGLSMKSSKGTRSGRSAPTRGPPSQATSSVDASEKITAYRNPERKPKPNRFAEVRSKDVKRDRNYPIKGRHVPQQSLTCSSTWNNVTDEYDQYGDENGDAGTSEEPQGSAYQSKRSDSSRQAQFTHSANTDGTSGTFPRTQRGHRGTSGRFTRSGHVTGYEDYYNKGYSNHQESSYTDTGGQCDSDVAPRHPQLVSFSRGKHRGHSGFQTSRKGDSDEGHHGYIKSKSMRQFSRSGDPSQRYRDEQIFDGGDQKHDQSSVLARGPSKASNSFRQREEGQNMPAQHDARSTARRPPKNSKSGNRQAVQSANVDDVDLSCPPTTATTSEGETGVDQNTGGPSSGNRTAQSTEESFKHTSSNSSRRGFKSCPRTRRTLGSGRYRNQGAQQFRSTDEVVRPRRDKINRHPDDDHDEGGNSVGIAGRSGSGGTGACSSSTTGVGNRNEQTARQTNSSGEVKSEQTVDDPTTGQVGDSTPACDPVESDVKDDLEVDLEINNSSTLVKPSPHLSPTNGSNNQYPKYPIPRRHEGAYSGNSYTDRRGRVDRYGRPRFENRNRGHSSFNGSSVIVPLMSINAEAPPSFCNNPSFLDSPSDDSLQASSLVDGDSQAVYLPEQDGDTASAATNTDSSNDGFTEVRSKSSKNRRRLLRKTQSAAGTDKKSASSTDPEQQRSSIKTSGLERAKSRTQPVGSPKLENKNQQRQTGEASQKVKQLENVSQPPSKTSPANKTPKKPQAKNAWTIPLQTTISAPTKTEVSGAGAVETSKTSYAWSKVVGSKVLSSDSSASNNGQPASKSDNSASVKNSEDPNTKLKNRASFSPPHSPSSPTQAPNERPANSEALKSGTSSVVESLRDSVEYSSSALWYSSEKVQVYENRPSFQSGTNQIPVTSTSSSGVAIANVCKVRPQKQPQPVSSPSVVTTCSRQTASPVQTSAQSSGTDAFLALNSGARRDVETASTRTAPPGIGFSYSAGQSRSPPAPDYNQFSQRGQQKQSNKSSPSFAYDVEPASAETVTPWPSTSKAYGFQPSTLNQHLPQATLPLDIYSEQPQISTAKGCLNIDSDGMMTAATAAMFMHHPHAVSAPYRHSLPQIPLAQQPQGSSLMGLSMADIPRHQSARADSQSEGFIPPYPAAAPNASSQMRGLYSLVQPPQQPQPMHPGPRNYPQWPASALENLHSAQQASGLLLPPSQNVPGPILPSQYGPGYHQHPSQQPTHGFAPIVSNSYVGVIGSDRPSSNHGQQNRMHSGQLQQPPMYGAAPTQPPICGPLASTGFLPPSLYGRNLTGAGSSPTHPTPPPHGGINAFDHSFAMTGGLHGCSPHSSGLFSQPTGHPPTHRQHMHGNSPSSSSTDVVPGAAVCINPHNGFALQVPVPPTGAPLGGGHAGFPY
uniref:Protein PRRC2C n=1 Tax=Schistocephalus solidus TaxID=70667 RepID=A0A0X3NM61_SCHSO